MNELYHYGVKGMRWGVRKKKINSDRKISKLKAIRDQDVKVAETNYIKNAYDDADVAIGKEWSKNLMNLDLKTISKKDIRKTKNDAINFINNMDDDELRAYMRKNKIERNKTKRNKVRIYRIRGGDNYSM